MDCDIVQSSSIVNSSMFYFAGTFPYFPVSGPSLPDVNGFQVLPDSVFPPQLRSSSRALTRHLHFHNWSAVFSFVLSFNEPEPFQPSPSHGHRYRFHHSFLHFLLIYPVFHCPSHHYHLCCCHTLFIFNLTSAMFRNRNATSVQSLSGISGT